MVNMKTRSRMSERANVWIFFVFLIILLFSVTAFAQPAKTWRTGQTVSYATGDDGDLQKGVAWPAPRFTDNGDGTVTDHLTGLIWLKNANCFGTRNWSNALADSNSLASGSCGLTDGSESGDWRLPNRKELFSIFDYSRSDPALPHGHPFTNIGFTQYWSATTSMVPYNNNYAAYVVSISGGVYHNDKTLNNHVWPVRDSDDPGYPTED